MNRFLCVSLFAMLFITASAQTSGGQVIRKPQNKQNKNSTTKSLNGKVYTVRNVKEFLDAIGSNRTIVINSPTPLELTEEMRNRLNAGTLKEHKLVNPNSEGLFADWGYGPGVVFSNLKNLIIQGTNNKSEITIESAYCPVIRMTNCSNIKIEKVTLGHNTGTCGAPVIILEKSHDLLFSSCNLFGCGSEGFSIEDCTNITCRKSKIYQCNYSISTIEGKSKSIKFFDCDIYNINGGLNVEEGPSNIIFERCKFRDIDGVLFKNVKSNISLQKCEISHDKTKLGDIKKIDFSDCIWK